MSWLSEDVTTLLVRELEGFGRELDLFPDDASIWSVVPGVTNSAGTLALHVAGNLQHYVGAVLGGTGYVRDRPHEFACRDGSRESLKAELDAAARVVRDVLSRLPEQAYLGTYPDSPVPGTDIPTRRFLLHLCSHAAMHLGQVGYLRRALTGRDESAGPASVRALGIEKWKR